MVCVYTVQNTDMNLDSLSPALHVNSSWESSRNQLKSQVFHSSLIFVSPACTLGFPRLLQEEAEAKRGTFVHGKVVSFALGLQGGMYADQLVSTYLNQPTRI